jgi:diacylglycerol O-acyltransferase / wax synthase
MHVGAVMMFDGDAPPYDDFVEHIENRLAMVPRYRQRLANVPLGQGRPKWTDDEDFDICFHVRSTALPAPGGERQLKRLASRVLAQPLNRDKPLWEMWLVEGLEDGNFAVISKTHHAMVDGISGLDILSVLFADDDEQRAQQSRAWEPQPAPGGLSMLVEALLERVTQPTEIVRTPLRLLRRPRQVARKAFEYAAGAGALAWAGIQPAPRTPYNDQIVGTNRRFTWVRGNLDDVKAIKTELGGTVNDVILTVVARALRAHLQKRGENIDGLTVKAFVPVSMRADEDRGGEKLGNQVGGIIAPLPIGCDDPRDCLSQINEVMSGLKKSGQPIGAKALTELTGFAPPNLIDQAVRLPIPQRFVNLVVTNVPGPQFELSMGDRALQDIFPMVPLGNNMNLGVAIVSYNGTIDIGLVGDYDALYDLDDLGELFETAVAELAETAGVSARADVSATDDEVSTARSGGGNGGAPERRFGRDRPYEPAPEYRDETQTIVAERPVFPEPPVETEDELVEQVAERGAETAPGPEIEIDEPWEGYARMTAAEIRRRLASEPPAVAGLVEIYERANKGRKQVIDASEKAQRGQL